MNTNAAALEVSYLVAAGYSPEQANAFIATEQFIVSENKSEMQDYLSKRMWATPEQIADAEVQEDSAFAKVK